jgi:4-amino-4-deoxy-L-arabinose transferase-like glycosyltransferase
VGLIAFLIMVIGVLGATPPISRDALTHHLYVPKLFIEAGGIVELPHIPFSYYPMNLDLLYMIPLYFGNDILPKNIHFLFALITAWLIFRYLDKRIGRVYGLFSAFFFLSIPVVIKLSSTVYVDLGLICLTTASILMLAEWREMGFPLMKLVWAGFFCGLALGTKYNGLVTFVLLALIVPVLYLRAHPRTATYQVKSFYHGAIFAAVALLVFSPWMIRNIVWTGNPIYPLYQNIFQQSGQVHPDKHQASPVDEEEVGGGRRRSSGLLLISDPLFMANPNGRSLRFRFGSFSRGGMITPSISTALSAPGSFYFRWDC